MCLPRRAATLAPAFSIEEAAVNGYDIKAIDDMEAIHHGLVKLAGAELSIQSFGMQVLDVPPGFTDYPEHDHADDGQEEVYAVLRGQAEFVVDGEVVPVGEGEILRVDATSRRTLAPGPEGVRILAVGCSPAGAYERPADFRGAVRS
jgi:mannose-6-phosphate isomerase-like protein (cupin superfamily)